MSNFLVFIQNRKIEKRKLNCRPNFWRRFCFNAKTLNVVLLVCVCLAGVFYLSKINSMAIKGFQIKDLEEKQAALKDNIRKSELRAAELQSSQKIQDRIAALEMVSVAKVEYAKEGGVVAVR